MHVLAEFESRDSTPQIEAAAVHSAMILPRVIEKRAKRRSGAHITGSTLPFHDLSAAGLGAGDSARSLGEPLPLITSAEERAEGL